MDRQRTFKVVQDVDDADVDALCVHLFEDAGDLLGWFLGPASLEGGHFSLPYLDKAKRTGAATALAQAMGSALVSGRGVCIVDPQSLWVQF